MSVVSSDVAARITLKSAIDIGFKYECVSYSSGKWNMTSGFPDGENEDVLDLYM